MLHVFVIILAIQSSLCVDAKVYELNDDSFDQFVSVGPWFIEFYAPWCSHCKKLAPVIDEAAGIIGNKVKIAKVDATANPKLKSKYDISGFPKLMFFDNGQPIDTYIGGRDTDSLVKYCFKQVAPPLLTLKNSKELVSNSSTRTIELWPVSFVLGFSDQPEKSRRNEELKALVENAAQLKKTTYHVFTTSDQKLLAELCPGCSFPLLFRFEPGEDVMQYKGHLDEATLLDWLERTAFPVFGQLASHNFRIALEQERKMIVIAIYNASRQDESNPFLKNIHRLATRSTSPLPIEVFERYLFLHLDANNFLEFITDYDIEPETLPRILIINTKDQLFYESISWENNIEQFLKDIVNGNAPYKRDGMFRIPNRLYRYFQQNPLKGIFALALIVAFVLFSIWLCCFFEVDDDIQEVEEEDEPAIKPEKAKKQD